MSACPAHPVLSVMLDADRHFKVSIPTATSLLHGRDLSAGLRCGFTGSLLGALVNRRWLAS